VGARSGPRQKWLGRVSSYGFAARRAVRLGRCKKTRKPVDLARASAALPPAVREGSAFSGGPFFGNNILDSPDFSSNIQAEKSERGIALVSKNPLPYSTVEYFALFCPKGAERRLVAMFRAYFDDSGTHVDGGSGPSKIVVIGGVLITDEEHDKLAKSWGTVLKEYNLPYFHLTKLKAGKKAPYPSMSADEKTKLLRRLMGLMKKRAEMTFACAVPVATYNGVLTATEKQRYGLPVAWAAQMCWTILRLWAEKNSYDDPIPFVVEAGTPGGDQVAQVFSKVYADDKMRQLYRLDSLTEMGKTGAPGLQCADIMANSTYELAVDQLAHGRRASRWMGIVSEYINKMEHHQIIPTASILRSEIKNRNTQLGIA
jgi:hypothetical protein